jgi:urea transporter
MKHAALSAEIHRILTSYAALLFSDSAGIGLLFFSASFYFPNVGLCGLAAVGFARVVMHGFKFAAFSNAPLYNSLLVGLSLGSQYQLDGRLLLVMACAVTLTVFCCVISSDFLWRTHRLPVLSLPFLGVALLATFATQGYGLLDSYTPPLSYEPLFSTALDFFFTALAGIFFTPVTAVGLALFLGISITSRYLALLAVCGFIVGEASYTLLSGVAYSPLSLHSGFNFSITAMALGGIFMLPSRASFAVAMGGAALSAFVATAMQTLLLPFGVAMWVLPFLITVFTVLAALNYRSVNAAPVLLLDNPALPELSLERARLANVRSLTPAALVLAAPFMGEWRVYQGFDGEHTHQAPWQHALDFIVTNAEGKSYHTSGEFLADYYSFGLPVLSPVVGQVVSCADYLPDHAIGEVDTYHNWGNYVLLYVAPEHYVLLAHLQQHSLQVAVGEWVSVGQKLAQCGNTGRSPQPHIHLHVQKTAFLGSPTVDFLLANFVVKNEQRQFYLTGLPAKNTLVNAIMPDSKLAQALHLPVGKQLCYRFRKNAEAEQLRCFTVKLTLTGEFRLEAESGASAAFVKTDKVLAFYDRNAVDDVCLDIFMLTLGFTPLVNGGELHWHDKPTARLVPLPPLQKALYRLLPFGHQLYVHYQRQWQEAQEGWAQLSTYDYRCAWHKKQTFQGYAQIVPEHGCVKLHFQAGQHRFEAVLQGCGRTDDIGVPAPSL